MSSKGTREWGLEGCPHFENTRVHVLGGAMYGAVVRMMAMAGMKKAETIGEADLVVFVGGADVNPAYYDQKQIKETGTPDIARDAFERLVFEECVKLDIPMLGICRGAQMLHVLNRGELYQHVDNHGGTPHMIYDIDEDVRVEATSLHHQMMKHNDRMDLLAVTEKPVATIFKDGKGEYKQTDNEESIIEVEACYYHDTKCFLVQGHPEVGSPLYRSWVLHKLFDILLEWSEYEEVVDATEGKDECAA